MAAFVPSPRWSRMLAVVAGFALAADLVLIGMLVWPDLVPPPLRQALRTLDLLLTLSIGLAMIALIVLLRRTQQAVEEAAERQQMLLDAVPAALSLWRPDGTLEAFNPPFLAAHAGVASQVRPGARLRELLEASVARGLVTEAQGREAAWVEERLAAFDRPGRPMMRRTVDGRWRRVTEVRLPDGRVLGHGIDVTELEAARAEAARLRERLEDAIEALPAGFELYDAEDRLLLTNQTMRTMYPAIGDLLDRQLRFEDLVRENHARGGLPLPPDTDFETWLAQRLVQRRSGGAPRVHALPDGQWIRTYERPTREGGLVGVRIDVSALQQRDRQLAAVNAALEASNAELQRLSETDPLTGVANRRRFDEALAAALRSAAATARPIALLMVDIDHFKRFNDHHGHPAGDACLRRVAAVLTAVVRGPGDLVARLGGEEFAVLLVGTEPAQAAATAGRCLALLADAALAHGDSPLGPHVTFSIGVSTATDPAACHGDDLIAAADRALYCAKQEGRARWAEEPVA